MFNSLIAGLLERAVLTDPLLERRLRLVQLDTAAVGSARARWCAPMPTPCWQP